MAKACPICKKKVIGRADKKFCSIKCKSEYHHRLHMQTKTITTTIDRILHRNRSILREVMGKRSTKKKISRLILDQKNFNYDFITGLHINTKNKTIHHVYDYSWAIFSDQEILIFFNEKLGLSRK